MNKILRIFFVAFVMMVSLVSCKEARVIPSRKMQKIYREMFLADQWLADNPSKRKAADTTWFYEPIFEKYGYTVEDYRKSVDYYLNDPERYAEMLDKVVNSLDEEAARIRRTLEAEARYQERLDSLEQARNSGERLDMPMYPDLPEQRVWGESFHMEQTDNGAYEVVKDPQDTTFRGPKIIVREKTEETVKSVSDTVQTVEGGMALSDTAKVLKRVRSEHSGLVRRLERGGELK